MRSLLEISPLVALTLGADGCLVATRDEQTHIPPSHVEKVVDATGAGDAFAAAFLVEYIRTADPTAAARAANTLAGQVVGQMGAR